MRERGKRERREKEAEREVEERERERERWANADVSLGSVRTERHRIVVGANSQKHINDRFVVCVYVRVHVCCVCGVLSRVTPSVSLLQFLVFSLFARCMIVRSCKRVGRRERKTEKRIWSDIESTGCDVVLKRFWCLANIAHGHIHSRMNARAMLAIV
jgi:hypothetical protein